MAKFSTRVVYQKADDDTWDQPYTGSADLSITDLVPVGDYGIEDYLNINSGFTLIGWEMSLACSRSRYEANADQFKICTIDDVNLGASLTNIQQESVVTYYNDTDSYTTVFDSSTQKAKMKALVYKSSGTNVTVHIAHPRVIFLVQKVIDVNQNDPILHTDARFLDPGNNEIYINHTTLATGDKLLATTDYGTQDSIITASDWNNLEFTIF